MEQGGERANPHPFIIPFLLIALFDFSVFCYSFALLNLRSLNLFYGIVLNYELYCHLYCAMLFNECVCAFCECSLYI